MKMGNDFFELSSQKLFLLRISLIFTYLPDRQTVWDLLHKFIRNKV